MGSRLSRFSCAHTHVLQLLEQGRVQEAQQVVAKLNVPALSALVNAVLNGKEEEIRNTGRLYLEAHRHVTGAWGIGVVAGLVQK